MGLVKLSEVTLINLVFISCVFATYNPFDDTILYNIKWPGQDSDNLLSHVDDENVILSSTDKGEKYLCFLPESPKTEKDSDSPYTGPSPLDLLLPLFTQSTCSYRLESYWTYEICHGRYVKQYHEDRDGKKIKRQEYFLGRWDLVMQNELSRRLESEPADNVDNIKTKKIEGMDIPYLQLNYTDGTVCELIGKPRQINVLYMCTDHTKHDLYSIKEISTCHYEAIIFTPLLCTHPLYKPKNSGEIPINCKAFENADKKPKALLSLESESFKLKHEQLMGDDQVLKKVFAVFSFDKSDNQVEFLNLLELNSEGEARLHVQIHPLDVLPVPVDSTKTKFPDVSKDVTNFLSGENCLEGGKGFWKFEFCYGRHINQYHEEEGSKTVINLGKFHPEDHKLWLEKNPQKKPKSTDTTISHHYSRGSFCEKTTLPRETEVRFKCIEGNNVSPSSIKLYLLEPQTCKYVLFVESPLICKLIPYINEFGMFDVNTKIANESEEKDEL